MDSESFALAKYFRHPYCPLLLPGWVACNQYSFCITFASFARGFDQWGTTYQEIRRWEEMEVGGLLCPLLLCRAVVLAVVAKTYQAAHVRPLPGARHLPRLGDIISSSWEVTTSHHCENLTHQPLLGFTPAHTSVNGPFIRVSSVTFF